MRTRPQGDTLPQRQSEVAATLRRSAERVPQVSVAQTSLDDAAGRYQVVKTIGAGGMGEVRLCRDHRIGREVAMKVIHRDHGSMSDARARFEREARVQGQLEHPAVVPVYDIGVGADGAYFTMKRIDGLTFEEILNALEDGEPEAVREYSLRRLLAAFSTVCLAVAFAHSRGVLHRDLKPANIMLGAFGEVHVLDWGLAKLAGAEAERAVVATGASSQPGRTQAGEYMGTPGYMAPEQVLGDWDNIDGRADVYALGAILFELLTLRQLHTEKDAPSLFKATLAGAEARPSVRTPERQVAPELEALCVRATAMEPADRIATARELGEAVTRYLDGDRDLELRRTLAETHAETAAVAAELALAGGADDQREIAMREAGAALALSPTHGDALRTMARLVLSPPERMPEEARREFHEASRVVEKTSARGTLMMLVAWLGFAPLVLVLGVKSWPLAGAAVSVVSLAVLAAYAVYRGERGGRAKFAVYCLGSLFVLLASSITGPLFLVPNLAVTNLLAYVAYGDRAYRAPALAIGIGTVLVPTLAQLAGLVTPFYRFEGGNMVIESKMVALPEAGTLLLLVGASLALVAAPAILAGRIVDNVGRGEEKSFLYAWNLQKLLPKEARPLPRTNG